MHLSLSAGGSPAAIVGALEKQANSQLEAQHMGEMGDEALAAIRGYVEGALRDVSSSGSASVSVSLSISVWKPCTPEQAAQAGF